MRVGDGNQVRVGEDAILGCGNNIFFPLELSKFLHDRGLLIVNQEVDLNFSSIWKWGWALGCWIWRVFSLLVGSSALRS